MRVPDISLLRLIAFVVIVVDDVISVLDCIDVVVVFLNVIVFDIVGNTFLTFSVYLKDWYSDSLYLLFAYKSFV